MNYSKKGWDIVSDLIRLLGDDGGLLNDIQTDMFHKDISNIMDYMFKGKTFKGAIKAYREEDSENALWLEEFLNELDLKL
jgi:hypothetical protein